MKGKFSGYDKERSTASIQKRVAADRILEKANRHIGLPKLISVVRDILALGPLSEQHRDRLLATIDQYRKEHSGGRPPSPTLNARATRLAFKEASEMERRWKERTEKKHLQKGKRGEFINAAAEQIEEMEEFYKASVDRVEVRRKLEKGLKP